MGQDKRAIEIAGERLLDRALRIAGEAAGRPATLVGDNLEKLAPEGVRVIGDARPARGPLGGLVAALEACREPRALILAADLPGLEVEDLRALLDAAQGEERVVALEGERGPEPLAAVYPTAAAPLWRRRLEEGDLILRQGLEALTAATLAPPGGRSALLNLNHPEDLDRFLQGLPGRGGTRQGL